MKISIRIRTVRIHVNYVKTFSFCTLAEFGCLQQANIIFGRVSRFRKHLTNSNPIPRFAPVIKTVLGHNILPVKSVLRMPFPGSNGTCINKYGGFQGSLRKEKKEKCQNRSSQAKYR